MSGDEKGTWVFTLWFLSLGTVVWISTSPYSGEWDSPLIVFTIIFAIAAIIWLFRVTYLAGRRRR